MLSYGVGAQTTVHRELHNFADATNVEPAAKLGWPVDSSNTRGQRLPAPFFLAALPDHFAQRPMCRLSDLFNPFEDVFAFPFVNRHPEGLPAVRGLDDRNRQIAADVCLRFWFLRRLSGFGEFAGSGRQAGGTKEAGVRRLHW